MYLIGRRSFVKDGGAFSTDGNPPIVRKCWSGVLGQMVARSRVLEFKPYTTAGNRARIAGNPVHGLMEYATNVKKDQRVDYALLKDGNPIILIECKAYGADLGIEYVEQLKRYFTFVKTAKIGVLTDGNRYRFFTDLEETNIMDDDPYMEFSLENPDKGLLPKLLMLRKEQFNDEDAIKDAEQLKYTNQFKKLLAQQAEDPDDPFVEERYQAVC
ncbi:MAG TPA: type I restriction enzyme HsdR N-terminal domain-containing protein [Candidatus Aphodousia faecigallinarum]|uniref:Type I restriction enzyme HsdR N-terminal domain-containing protein n=1 Tax=Candidatus Aphodousia faecigallinarum TaxID=2840677 RepID=A0A9D1IJZ6_9BURK|nr:type I restriction enzyme HsdR N-terminal domain-containing protein [Candidatus Aphodousia faecigallinarum]